MKEPGQISIEDINKKLDLIIKEQIEIKDLLLFISKRGSPNKLHNLTDQVKIRKRMNTPDVVKFIGCTKKYALELMRRLEAKPGFYLSTDVSHQKSFSISFMNDKERTDRAQGIKKLFEKQDKISISDLMDIFSIDFIEAKICRTIFVSENENYCIVDNYLIKRIADLPKSITR